MGNEIELDCKYVTATEEAVCVKYESVKFWLPKSQVRLNDGAFAENEFNEGDDVAVTLPERLAIGKGMV